MCVSCTHRIPGNYTQAGIENYIKADKKISKENRQYKRIQRERIRKIYKLQHSRVIPYK